MKDVKLPELAGESEVAVISMWHMEEGDPVEEGDALVEVTADNETFDVLSPCAGILKEIFFEEGDEVEVGETLGTVENECEDKLSLDPEDDNV